MILRGGANIYPAEVEAALDAHPDVGSSVAIGLPDAEMGQRVHAIVQPKAHASGRLNVADLQEFLMDRIARYKVPESYEFTDNYLRDDAGKVRRSALRDERVAWLRELIRVTLETHTAFCPLEYRSIDVWLTGDFGEGLGLG